MLQINVTIFVEICNIKNAKVVQGSSHDVVGLVAFFKQQHGQISDNNIPYTSLLKFFERNLII